MALSCLIVSEFWYFSDRWQFSSQCGQWFFKSYPSLAYLLVGYTFVHQSARVQQAEDLATASSHRQKQKLARWYKVRFGVGYAIPLLIVAGYLAQIGIGCKSQSLNG